MRYPTNKQHGFTLIELALAITFLGTLVMFTMLATVQAINIYNKGLAIKQINQAGRSLMEDINRLSTSGYDVTVADNNTAGYLCIEVPGSTRGYVWNDMVRFVPGSPASAPDKRFRLGPGAGSPVVTMARTTDEAVTNYCGLPATGADTIVTPADVTVMLTPQIRVLSVDIASPSKPPTPNLPLQRLTFWIGTTDGSDSGSALIPGMLPTYDPTTKTWACEGGALGTFCAVGKFETIVLTNNKRPE